MPTRAVVCVPTYDERENLEPLLERMAASSMEIERIDPAGPMYRYLT